MSSRSPIDASAVCPSRAAGRRPSRRALGRAATLLSLAACGPAGGAAEHASLPRERVPVVLILVDTLRADRLGCYGNARDTSPQLDALADEGVLFRSCLASSTWTKPATASVLTGRRPSGHGATRMVGALRGSVTTLAEMLRGKGYRTAGFGSNGFVFGAEQGFERGFDVFEAGWDLGAGKSESDALRADVLVDAAIDWLDSVDGEPFFLYLHAIDPHSPYDPPEGWRERFSPRRQAEPWTDERLATTPSLGTELPPAALQRMLDLYDAELAFADDQLGRLFDALRRIGAYDEALIVFLSDHGEEFHDHGEWGHNPRMYQEVLHVPLIVRFPWSIRSLSGAVHEGTVRQVDVLPTVADVLGLTAPEGPGRSLLAQLLRPDAGTPIAIAEATYRGASRRTIVREGMKYVQVLAPEPGELLFDLERDPGERRDLSAERPGVARALRGALEERLPEKDASWIAMVHNGTSEPVTIAGLVGTEAPVRLDPLQLEMERGPRRKRDGPLRARRVRHADFDGWAAGFRFHVAPGDRDGVVFVPRASEDAAAVRVYADGEPLEIVLGASGEADVVDGEYTLDLTRTDLLFSGVPAPDADDEGQVVVRLWQSVEAEPTAQELSPETERNLRQLGYLGE